MLTDSTLQPEDTEEANAAAPSAVSVPAEKEQPGLKEQLFALSEDQLKIIAVMDKNSAHVDDIIANTGYPAGKVLSQLTLLEIKGIVRREGGRRSRQGG